MRFRGSGRPVRRPRQVPPEPGALERSRDPARQCTWQDRDIPLGMRLQNFVDVTGVDFLCKSKLRHVQTAALEQVLNKKRWGRSMDNMSAVVTGGANRAVQR
eukprot:4798084-Alexandrium_andersonii.AAC.1